MVKGDTAIKGRELLVVEEPSPVACIAHNIFGETPMKKILLTLFKMNVTRNGSLLKQVGPLTQSVEYLPFKQRVAGSSPARPTINETAKRTRLVRSEVARTPLLE